MIIEKFLQIFNRTLPTSLITFIALGCTATAQQSSSVQYCAPFDLELSGDFVVYGVDGYYAGSRTLPYPIDDSNLEAHEINIIVNSPSQPAVVLLKSSEPEVYSIQRTEDTELLAVVVDGSSRQEVVGVTEDTPVLISSLYHCEDDGYLGSNSLESLSERLFARSLEPNPSDYYAENLVSGELLSEDQKPSDYYADNLVLGELLTEDQDLVISDDIPVESFFDRTAPRVGQLGIEDALKQGVLRKATMEDVKAWVEAHTKRKESTQEIFPSAEERAAYKAELIDELQQGSSIFDKDNSYVVLDDFTYPAGLYSGELFFFVSQGVNKPSGDPGFSSVHDSSGKCFSTICSITVDEGYQTND